MTNPYIVSDRIRTIEELIEYLTASREEGVGNWEYVDSVLDDAIVVLSKLRAPVAGEARRLPTINVGGKERPQQWFTAKEVRQLLDAAPQASAEKEQKCSEADGCPTELAVLKRFWREHQSAAPQASEKQKENNG